MEGPGSGTLFVVATPIGNLEDITLRALRVLRDVAIVAAEDTRHTGNLLRHYKIGTPLLSLHQHNEQARVAGLIRRLQSGHSIALVSDAGTPGISDPGAGLVRAAREAGIRVEPVPGASAVTALLSASGLAFDRFAFAGFPPIRLKDRNSWFEWVRTLSDVPVVVFEAPHRVHKTLAEMATQLGKRPIIIARELTKIHEEWLEGTASVLAGRQDTPKGEFVLVLGPIQPELIASADIPDSQVRAIFGQITEIGAPTRRQAVKATAAQLGISAKEVYAAIERAKSSVK